MQLTSNNDASMKLKNVSKCTINVTKCPIYMFPFSCSQLSEKLESSRLSQRSLPGLTPFFYVENLVPRKTGVGAYWTRVGYVNGSEVQINAIFWPGRGYKGVSEQNKRLSVALAEAHPFVMTSPLI